MYADQLASKAAAACSCSISCTPGSLASCMVGTTTAEASSIMPEVKMWHVLQQAQLPRKGGYNQEHEMKYMLSPF
jgi:hypothetical protein